MENEQNKPMQTPAPYAAGTGSVPVALDRDAFARMGYRERLALKKENPEVYKELRKCRAASWPPLGGKKAAQPGKANRERGNQRKPAGRACGPYRTKVKTHKKEKLYV